MCSQPLLALGSRGGSWAPAGLAAGSALDSRLIREWAVFPAHQRLSEAEMPRDEPPDHPLSPHPQAAVLRVLPACGQGRVLSY